jgi:hypothetical protein
MWQIWLIGILGLWIVLVVFLGFSSILTAFFLIVSGLAISFLAFRLVPFIKIPPKKNNSEILPPNETSQAPSESEPDKVA